MKICTDKQNGTGINKILSIHIYGILDLLVNGERTSLSGKKEIRSKRSLSTS